MLGGGGLVGEISSLRVVSSSLVGDISGIEEFSRDSFTPPSTPWILSFFVFDCCL